MADSSSGMKATGRGRAVERSLLAAILVLQIIILLRPQHTPTPHTPVAPPLEEPSSSDTAGNSEPISDSPLYGVTVSEGLASMHSRMNAMLERAMDEFEAMDSFLNLRRFDHGWASLMTSPTVDMWDHDDVYVVLFSLPDLNASDIKVALDGRLLTVFNEPAHMGTHFPHRRSSFERSVWLPGPVDVDGNAEAMVTNGVLRVVVPKLVEDEAPDRFDERQRT